LSRRRQAARRKTGWAPRAWFLVVAGLAAAGCASEPPASAPSGVPTPSQPSTEPATPTRTATQANAWDALLAVTPVGLTTPAPPADETAIDGLYAHYDPSWPQWWLCLRCADYRPAGGLWRLQFDRGVMRILYEVTQWRSLASYTVEGDRLFLFNDPYCPYDAGEYTWSVADGALALSPINDGCSFDLRSQTLGGQVWAACDEDEASQASTDPHILRGCQLSQASDPTPLPAELPVAVRVLSWDSRELSVPPDLYADANSANGDPVDGVVVTSSPESIPYGRYRILWRPEDWLTATTERSFGSMGVQFLGSQVIGWARVLFDGTVVWHGETSTLGSDKGIYGGYVEISGYAPGRHTIRVERIDIDSRPVAVLFFGFQIEGGVQE
jgi:hypothetical protein